MQSINADGLLGLCPTPSLSGQPVFIESLYQNNVIDQEVFAIYSALEHTGSQI
jgi:hypothetical protein